MRLQRRKNHGKIQVKSTGNLKNLGLRLWPPGGMTQLRGAVYIC